MDDRDLAHSPNAQLRLIMDAYATGSPQEIDAALFRVTDVRCLKKTGLQDLFGADEEADGDD